MKLSRWVKLRNEKFGGLIVDTKGEKVYATNAVGTEVLERMRGPVELETLLRQLNVVYDAEPEIIRQHVWQFVNELRRLGLIAEE